MSSSDKQPHLEIASASGGKLKRAPLHQRVEFISRLQGVLLTDEDVAEHEKIGLIPLPDEHVPSLESLSATLFEDLGTVDMRKRGDKEKEAGVIFQGGVKVEGATVHYAQKATSGKGSGQQHGELMDWKQGDYRVVGQRYRRNIDGNMVEGYFSLRSGGSVTMDEINQGETEASMLGKQVEGKKGNGYNWRKSTVG